MGDGVAVLVPRLCRAQDVRADVDTQPCDDIGFIVRRPHIECAERETARLYGVMVCDVYQVQVGRVARCRRRKRCWSIPNDNGNRPFTGCVYVYIGNR